MCEIQTSKWTAYEKEGQNELSITCCIFFPVNFNTATFRCLLNVTFFPSVNGQKPFLPVLSEQAY